MEKLFWSTTSNLSTKSVKITKLEKKLSWRLQLETHFFAFFFSLSKIFFFPIYVAWNWIWIILKVISKNKLYEIFWWLMYINKFVFHHLYWKACGNEPIGLNIELRIVIIVNRKAFYCNSDTNHHRWLYMTGIIQYWLLFMLYCPINTSNSYTHITNEKWAAGKYGIMLTNIILYFQMWKFTDFVLCELSVESTFIIVVMVNIVIMIYT